MQRRILIIDDHDDLATALEEVFTRLGHSVVMLENRADALEATNPEQFALIISDLDRLGREAVETGRRPETGS